LPITACGALLRRFSADWHAAWFSGLLLKHLPADGLPFRGDPTPPVVGPIRIPLCFVLLTFYFFVFREDFKQRFG
jgi:hypothetical protein